VPTVFVVFFIFLFCYLDSLVHLQVLVNHAHVEDGGEWYDAKADAFVAVRDDLYSCTSDADTNIFLLILLFVLLFFFHLSCCIPSLAYPTIPRWLLMRTAQCF